VVVGLVVLVVEFGLMTITPGDDVVVVLGWMVVVVVLE
jgi:hypothetical protein